VVQSNLFVENPTLVGWDGVGFLFRHTLLREMHLLLLFLFLFVFVFSFPQQIKTNLINVDVRRSEQ
jgi:hypothetical protein